MMPEKSRAEKLAAAKKKLKEYHESKERRQNETIEANDTNCNINTLIPMSPDCDDTQSNCKLDGEETKILPEDESMDSTHMFENYFSEKAAIISKLTKAENSCKEKDLEIEVLNSKLSSAHKRIENLENIAKDTSTENYNLKKLSEDLEGKISSFKVDIKKYINQCENYVGHIEELKLEIKSQQKRIEELEETLKEKSCELELTKIRLNQISDETCVVADNRVEALTQTNLIYEQQIRDLQNVVQQLTLEKGQSEQQYQTYVQQLTKETSTLSENNLELVEEKMKLLDREKSLVEHIQYLEKQIQENLANTVELIGNTNEDTVSRLRDENNTLKEKISKLEGEQVELHTTIKQQDKELKELSAAIVEKQAKIEELEGSIINSASTRSEDEKLLAAMESNKVAASRAVAQNEELKKQLDEIQRKLVQVTNEKAELLDHLHSEKHMNKEMRNNYMQINENLQQLTEKLHFKDEEMIRLTHENNQLSKKVLELNQKVDQLKHYEVIERTMKSTEVSWHSECEETPDCETIEHNHNEESPTMKSTSLEIKKMKDTEIDPTIEGISPKEAMQKLEERFKTLIGEIAILTDEKQHLEHLVLQLQDETETIGEYITLYQTQRRMLKQKEIEKNAQLYQLLSEKEEMREKITELTTLIKKLGIPMESKICDNYDLLKPSSENEESSNFDDNSHEDNLHQDGNLHFAQGNESEKIITKIKTIISEIEKSNSESNIIISVDHCACCSGKFETI